MTDINYENNKILDVVNENDEIIDSAPRTDIHRLGLLHREIQVWMFDQDKNIFFQKVGLHKKSAGLLDATVSGHLNKSEAYLEAAIRETEEETGIVATPDDLIFLKKIKFLNRPQDDLDGTTNNFIRSIYVYKNPIDEKMLKKEEGIPGGGFQKLSHDFLINISKKDKTMIKDFVLTKEIPLVLNYLANR